LYRFYLNLHHPQEAPIFDSEALKYLPDYKYTIKFFITKTTADEDLARVPFERRNCKMPFEHEQKLFKVYKRKNCIYENVLQKAYARRKCWVWNFPTLQNEAKFNLCHKWENHFQNIMHIASKSKGNINCPESCDLTSYTYQVKMEKFDPYKECRKLEYFIKAQNANHSWPKIHFLLQSLKHEDRYKLEHPRHHCVKLMRGSTILDISTDYTTFHVVNQHLKVTFALQLANLGNQILRKYKASFIFRRTSRSLYWNEPFEHC